MLTLTSLPSEIILLIFEYLDVCSLQRTTSTCWMFHTLAKDDLLWRLFAYRHRCPPLPLSVPIPEGVSYHYSWVKRWYIAEKNIATSQGVFSVVDLCEQDLDSRCNQVSVICIDTRASRMYVSRENESVVYEVDTLTGEYQTTAMDLGLKAPIVAMDFASNFLDNDENDDYADCFGIDMLAVITSDRIESAFVRSTPTVSALASTSALALASAATSASAATASQKFKLCDAFNAIEKKRALRLAHSLIVTAGDDMRMWVWRYDNHHQRFTSQPQCIANDVGSIYSVDIDPKHIYVGLHCAKFLIVDINTLERVQLVSFCDPSSYVSILTVSPWYLVAAGTGSLVCKWSLAEPVDQGSASTIVCCDPVTLDNQFDYTTTAKVDRERLATLASDGTLRLWWLRNGDEHCIAKLKFKQLREIKYNRALAIDPWHLALGTDDGKLLIWKF
ncbi:hypothetical protein GQ42DRAFT_22194 [Ramicandelaber brevisporus]|nr:hypothetical protein GQ42DRAFT_22194 [Ramicandelaber brevisporus]